jgi:hypothetical protein
MAKITILPGGSLWIEDMDDGEQMAWVSTQTFKGAGVPIPARHMVEGTTYSVIPAPPKENP